MYSLSLCHVFVYRNAWSRKGCTPVVQAENRTICQCNHLTNFAILMSPWTEVIVRHFVLLLYISMILEQQLKRMIDNRLKLRISNDETKLCFAKFDKS